MIRPLYFHTAGVIAVVGALGVAAWSFNESSATASAASTAVVQAAQPGAKQAIGRGSNTLTPGILIGNTLYISGQLGRSGRAGGIGGETEAAINAAQNVLKEAQMDLSDVVAVTVYLTDVADFQGMNQAYTKMFTSLPRPTRTTDVVKELVVSGAKVEVTMMAVKAR